MAAKKTTRAPRAPKVTLAGPPVAPEARRCRYEAAGARCEAAKLSGKDFCREHWQEVGDVGQMRENEVLGGAETAEAVRAELDMLAENARLRSELEAMRAQSARLLAMAQDHPQDALLERALAQPSAPANVDPEIEGGRLVAAMTGQTETQATGRPPELQPLRDLPPEAEGTALAVALLRQQAEAAQREQHDRRKSRKARGLSADEGRVPIELRVEMPPQLDPAAIVDAAGQNLIPPGFVGRWVRGYDVDPNGGRNQTDYKYQVMRQMWGAQPVMEPVYREDEAGNLKKTGETREKRGLLGRAVMYPLSNYAKRVIYHSPAGAFDQSLDKEIGRLDNLVEETNSAYGKRGGVVQTFVGQEHGDRSG